MFPRNWAARAQVLIGKSQASTRVFTCFADAVAFAASQALRGKGTVRLFTLDSGANRVFRSWTQSDDVRVGVICVECAGGQVVNASELHGGEVVLPGPPLLPWGKLTGIGWKSAWSKEAGLWLWLEDGGTVRFTVSLWFRFQNKKTSGAQQRLATARRNCALQHRV